MKKEEYIIGIDDAGRGPVIGPMVLAGVLISKEKERKLKSLGVKDSKMLIHSTRIKLANEIQKLVEDFDIIILQPDEIDKALSNSFNLNKLEAMMMAKIVNNLSKERKDKITIYIDCPSVNIKSWKFYFLEHIDSKENKEFIVEHKADINYPVVSAASILAKVKREEEVVKLKEMYNIDFGSGYPSDPTTIEWLKKYGKDYLKYGIIRKSWQTWKNHEKKEKQKELF
ncbi:MAG: ribonuclease HII [Candidatus Pacearchaeota archaeon]